MITAESLLSAIDSRRVALAALSGASRPLPYTDVALQVGIHSSVFSKMKNGDMPSEVMVGRLLSWIGDEKLAHCPTCPNDGSAFDESPDELDVDEQPEGEQIEADLTDVRTIWATGHFSNSEDPETQAAITRARELIQEGAVGVSVVLDVHPDDVEAMADFPVDEETGGVVVPDGFRERLRIRQTAIVGVPAYADAKLTIGEDGTLSGPVVFEGVYTGDGRLAALAEQIDLEDTLVPSSINYNRDVEGHDGPTIGYFTSFERRDGMATSARTELDDEAITASMNALEMPARYFAKSAPTKPEPMRISAPDANGYRSITGLAAPSGVCIRNSMKCWTWPGDKDKKHSHFHTGTLLRLDNGEDIRVGALTIGGAHLDAALAKQGVSARDASNYRDNANRVFALVRVWETRHGLMMSGVIPPDVSDGDVTRALACSPSIEFWPGKTGRTLVGLHLVPTPGLPVLASMGSAEMFVTDNKIELEEETPAIVLEEDAVEVHDEDEQDGEEEPISKADLFEAIKSLSEQLAGTEKKIETILALTPIADIEIPE